MTLYDRDYVGASEDAVAVDVSAVDYTGTPFRRLFIGAAGTVKIVSGKGNDVTYNAPIGYLYVQGSKIYHTGTSATSIVAEF